MKNPGNLGFLVLSRRLLTQMFAEMYGKWHSDSQAYVYLLMAACFTDQGDTPGCLKRGELFFSGRELSLRFAWSRRHVNHFIGELEQNGVVEVMKVQNCSKLRLLHYDTLCRMRVKNGADGRRRSAGDEMFEVFWEQYHDMTQQPALDIEAGTQGVGETDAGRARGGGGKHRDVSLHAAVYRPGSYGAEVFADEEFCTQLIIFLSVLSDEMF